MKALHEVTIRGIGSDGAGVGHLPDGRVVFVHRTAPGDRARIRLLKEKPRWARGELDTLLEPGPGRREAPCKHYERCGGCTLEHLTPDAQLAARRQMVLDALERIGGFDASFLPEPDLHPSPREFRYRNRARFTLIRTRTGPIAGFHRLEEPGRIEDLGGDCLALEPALARLWDGLRAEWGHGAGRLPGGRSLRLTLRTLADGRGILLVEPGRSGRALDEGAGDPEALLEAVDGLQSIWWDPGTPDGGEPPEEGLGGPKRLAGGDAPDEVWFGERIAVRPGQFLQVNREAAEHLHDVVLRELGGPRDAEGRPVNLVDAYCGHGVYGRRLARHGAHAVGIELDQAAVRAAAERPVPGFRMVQGRVEDVLPAVLEEVHDSAGATRVILNPPRSGTTPEVMEALAGRTGALDRIVYVSCDPATLARDLKLLGAGGGWTLERLQLFDLFPQTAHVETVATLRPARSSTSPN